MENPTAVKIGFAFFIQPELYIFLKNLLSSPEPLPLGDVMACRGDNGVVSSAPTNSRQKLGYNITVTSVLYVLPEHPPTKIINFLNIFVGNVN